MRIIVDGDGCAGIGIIEAAAKAFDLEMLILCDINHYITSDYAQVKYMDSGFQSVDMAVVNCCQKGDIVVSQDYGVAAMTLAKKAFCINPSGHIYNEGNIDAMLMQRHINSKIRRSGGRHPNARKRTREDDERLDNNLRKLIMKTLKPGE